MISVIIPTYNHLEDALKPCISSLREYTSYGKDKIEFLIIPNGCTDATVTYLTELERYDERFRHINYEQPLGYTKATNEGIKHAKGGWILFLNNDIQLLPQAQDQWLEMLLKPFMENPNVGMTCPMKGFCKDTGRFFAIFFCAMTSKKLIEEIGLLDETFSPGAGEDCDWSHKLENKGYKIVQVPSETPLSSMGNGTHSVGGFPIYHMAETTVHDPECMPDWNGVLSKNQQILRDRYMKGGKIKLNIGCGALKLEGYFNIDTNTTHNPDIVWDCTNLNLFMDDSVDEIIALHMIEHIDVWKVQEMLANWWSKLKYGGKLIIEVPNIELICENFGKADKKERYNLLNCIYGGVGASNHFWGWYPEILADHLRAVGFEGIVCLPEQFRHPGYNFRMECIK